MVEDENNGLFIELTREIAKRSGVNPVIKVMPIKRAIALFVNGKIDILLPALDSYFPGDFQTRIIRSEAIFEKKDYIFTLKKDPIFRTIKDLEGKTVGIVVAPAYPRELIENKKILFEGVETDLTNARKLLKGRFVATVIEEKSALKAFEKLKALDKIQYDEKHPVTRQNAYYAFHNTEEGRKIAELISNTIIEMKEDGSFLKIFTGGH